LTFQSLVNRIEKALAYPAGDAIKPFPEKLWRNPGSGFIS
jgi:hypothetical protein